MVVMLLCKRGVRLYNVPVFYMSSHLVCARPDRVKWYFGISLSYLCMLNRTWIVQSDEVRLELQIT